MLSDFLMYGNQVIDMEFIMDFCEKGIALLAKYYCYNQVVQYFTVHETRLVAFSGKKTMATPCHKCWIIKSLVWPFK